MNHNPGFNSAVLDRRGSAAQGRPVNVFGQVSPSSDSWGARVGFFLSIFFLFFFWLHLTVWGILVPQPGIEPGPSAVRARSPNHWATREFPRIRLELGHGSDSGLASCLFLTTFVILGNSLLCDLVPHLWNVMLEPPPRGLIGEEIQCEAFVFIKCLPRAFLYFPLYYGVFFWGGAGGVFSYDHWSPRFH